MAYNNFNRPYNNSGYGNNRGYNNNNYNNRPKKKHSGCRAGTDKKGNPYLTGWNYSKSRGMISFFAAPTSKTKKSTSGSGRTWYNWMLKVFNKRTLQTTIYSCLVTEDCSKAVIEKLGFVMNAKAPNGGYVGSFTRKR